MQSFCFLCQNDQVSPVTNHTTLFSVLRLYTGAREEVLLSSPIPTRNHAVLHHRSNLTAVLCISRSHSVPPPPPSSDHPRLAGQRLQDGQRERWLLRRALHPFSLPASALLTAPQPNTPQNQIRARTGEQVRWVHREKAINTSKTLLWLRLQPSTLRQS